MNSFKKTAFGLDISDLSLKIAKLKKKENSLSLVSFGESSLRKGIIEGGEIKDAIALGEAIKKIISQVKGEKINKKEAILCLPEEKSFLDIIQIPPIREEEMESAVKFEAENHIPLNFDEVYFDFKKITPAIKNLKYQEVLIAACPKDIVDPYLQAARAGGVKIAGLEPECLSVARALVKNKKTEKPLLIIDFGDTRSTFIIFSGRSLRFTSTIPISSQMISESIAKKMKVSLKEAEKLKKKEGLEGKEKVREAITFVLNDFVEQVKTHLDYYHSHTPKDQLVHDGKQLEEVLLCGGGANLKGMIKFLSKNLKVDVRKGNPWVNILEEPIKEVPKIPLGESLAFTTALGLALKGIGYD